MDSLIEWLVNYAFDHNIGVVLTPALQPYTPSTSDGTTRLVVINMNWHRKTEIPFALAHEIGHVINGDQGVHAYTATLKTKEEYAANVTGIRLIKDYCLRNEMRFDNYVVFCQQFGIPLELDYLASQIM